VVAAAPAATAFDGPPVPRRAGLPAAAWVVAGPLAAAAGPRVAAAWVVW